MRLPFTKMQGAGNDFVVLDATRNPIDLSEQQLRRLADRRFGVGADQILIVERSAVAGIDFRYRIFNADGSEVEQCGNGARCFVRYVHDHGLTVRRVIRVETLNSRLELRLGDDDRVTVDMGAPVFDTERVPFDAAGLIPRIEGQLALWPIDIGEGRFVESAVVAMGNPHAVQRVDDVKTAPVAEVGPLIERHARFPNRVNVGFMQAISRSHIALRVYERGTGETLACGTGACAAVVAGIRLGWLDRCVDVDMRGGSLRIEWSADDATVLMTGPAETVFEGEIEL
jgi:diaminopimelate epimerase